MLLVTVLAYKNIAPFGATVTYQSDLTDSSDNLTLPSPLETYTVLGEDAGGAEFQVTRSRMVTDKADFMLKTPYGDLSTAIITVSYEGDPRELLLGMRNPSSGDYLYHPLHNRSLNDLAWERLEDDETTLFQRSPVYDDLDGFIADLPEMLKEQDGIQGRLASYHYELPYTPELDTDKANDGASIEASLRGSNVFYTYVKDLPLSLSFIKQDINFSLGSDELTVSVYKGDELLHSLKVPDDGDVSQSLVPSASQAVSLQVPGLEEGVYRVEFDCSEDVVVSDMVSQQRYICVEGHVYLVDNEIYNLGPTHPDTVYTNGKFLSAATLHYENYQAVTVNDDELLILAEEGDVVSTTLNRDTSKIVSELSDVIIMSEDGFFSFSEDSLFKPYDHDYLQYSEAEPTKGLEFIIAGYKVPYAEGALLRNTVHFALDSNLTGDGRLYFQLYAPGISQSKQELVLDSIEIVLVKE